MVGIKNQMRFLFFLLLLSSVQAQNFQITEISPQKIGEAEEWFEFRVSDTTAIDLSDYQISNTKNAPKLFSDVVDRLIFGAGVKAGETDLSFEIEDMGYFYFSKSPVSLTNSGGEIQILDPTGAVLTTATYPDTKAGKTKDYAWAEIWNWSSDFQSFLPLRSQSDSPNHTAGQPADRLPTPPSEFDLILTEASPRWTQTGFEFLEFLVSRGPEVINLKYIEFKHNGTSLFRADTDFLVAPGERIVLYLGTPSTGVTKRHHPYEIWSDARAGLSAGSGTIEVLAYTDTSRETTLDFVCWQNETLSQTEQKRVDKNILAGHWQGACYEVADLIENQSIARQESATDSNTQADFWAHFNGSPGQANQPTNRPPEAVITIQGSGKMVGSPPFSLNVTGTDSHDPDGDTDLQQFTWSLNGEVFSTQPNPANYKITNTGQYELTLVVRDASGAEAMATETIYVSPRISAPSAGDSLEFKAHLAATLLPAEKGSATTTKTENFFAPVLANQKFMEALFQSVQPPVRYPDYNLPEKVIEEAPPVTMSPRKIVLPPIVRQRLRKNLGLIWDWREAPWAAAVGSTSDGAIDQNSERFAVAFGVP